MMAGIRETLKFIARMIAICCILPFWAGWWLQSRFIGPDRALEYATEHLAAFPGLIGRYLRRAFLMRVLFRCDSTCEIGHGTIFSKVGAVIEANVYIGPSCHIGLAHLERDALLAACVHVTSGARMHGIDDPRIPIRDQAGSNELVHIGAGAWIGATAVVMADVGAGTVVGAGAVVTRPLPAYSIAVGVPARVVRDRLAHESPAEDERP